MILVIGAYIASGRQVPILSVNAESSEELLKEYAVKDTDSDGLADWEEALYGTDPRDAHSVRATLTDKEAVTQGIATPRYAGQSFAAATSTVAVEVPGVPAAPDSLTEQFSRLFFSNYMTTRGDAPPSPEAAQSFVTSAVAELTATHGQTIAYAAGEVRVSGSGAAALRTYAVAVENAFFANDPKQTASELAYFQDAVQKGDTSGLSKLAIISNAYAGLGRDLMTISVPTEAATAHLSFANAVARLSTSVADMGAFEKDPLRAMLGLGQYENDAESFRTALTLLAEAFTSNNLVLTPGEAGYYTYNMVQTAAITQ